MMWEAVRSLRSLSASRNHIIDGPVSLLLCLHPLHRSVSRTQPAGSRLILTVVLSLVSSLHSSRSAYASRPLRGERRESEADDVKGGGITVDEEMTVGYVRRREPALRASLTSLVTTSGSPATTV